VSIRSISASFRFMMYAACGLWKIIALGGTPIGRESCDQILSKSALALSGQDESALVRSSFVTSLSRTTKGPPRWTVARSRSRCAARLSALDARQLARLPEIAILPQSV
jgi:hypothetical protein